MKIGRLTKKINHIFYKNCFPNQISAVSGRSSNFPQSETKRFGKYSRVVKLYVELNEKWQKTGSTRIAIILKPVRFLDSKIYTTILKLITELCQNFKF